MSLYMDNLRRLASDSGIDVYGLGYDREKWESRLQGFAKLVEYDTLKRVFYTLVRSDSDAELFKKTVIDEFGVKL